MLLRDPHRPSPQPPVDRRPKLDRRAVRPHLDALAPPDTETLRVPGRELDLARRPLELELLGAFDGRAGEERPVPEELQALAARLGRKGLVTRFGRGGGARPRGQRRLLAEVLVREPGEG